MTTSARSKWIKWLLLVALVVAIALGLMRALNKREAQRAAAGAAAAAAQQEPVYQLSPKDLVTVQPQELEQVVKVSGSLKALQTALIKARVAGELQGLEKREGDRVSAGEVVARVDNTEALARVRQAEQQAKAAEAQMDIARRSLDNNQALVKQGFISATALETTSANLAAATANHLAAQAAADVARKSLADTTLRSPIAGLVSSRLAQNGERVGVDARILEVVDLSSFELEAALPPGDASTVQVGQKALLQIEGLAQPVEARVARINPSVQAGSRSVLIYLQVPAVAGMRQGLFAQGGVVTGQMTAPAVPLSAVRNDRPQPYIQVLNDGRIVHLLSVRAGLIREGTAVTLEAVAPAAAAPTSAATKN
jgi:RND family efflux transporter MFP subunit